MRFHTYTGAQMQLSPKELKRAFSGVTLAVRPCRTDPRYAFIVSECSVDGAVRRQILAKNKAEVAEACKHLMRWLDRCGCAARAPDRSRGRQERKEAHRRRGTPPMESR